MGIPVYFNTLIRNHSQDILYFNKQTVDYLFLDLNCLIHPTCKNLTDQDIFNEDQMIDDILRNIIKLTEYTRCQKLLYIAIDGIPPKGKMNQQRIRRFRGLYETKKWNSNCISPGTYFMEKLNYKLKEFIKTFSIDVLLSDSTERGEGEHKILSYIRKNNLNGQLCIYGLDADLIMLSLVSNKKDILLLRETTEYNIENTDTDYIYMNIDKLKDILLNYIGYNKSHIIDDYIFLCFLLGNDFIHHIPTLNLRHNGHDILLNAYKKLQKKYQGYFQLINRNNDKMIYWTFFKELIYELSICEKDILNRNLEKRKYQRSKLLEKYKYEFGDFKQRYNFEILQDKLTLENIYTADPEFINDLPLLLLNDSDKDYYDNKMKDTQEYIKSIIWCTHYYFKECINWKWSCESKRGPFLSDLYDILNQNNNYEISYDNKEYSIEELLGYILPNNNDKIHQYKINYKEYDLIVDLRYKRYLWECELDFIEK